MLTWRREEAFLFCQICGLFRKDFCTDDYADITPTDIHNQKTLASVYYKYYKVNSFWQQKKDKMLTSVQKHVVTEK